MKICFQSKCSTFLSNCAEGLHFSAFHYFSSTFLVLVLFVQTTGKDRGVGTMLSTVLTEGEKFLSFEYSKVRLCVVSTLYSVAKILLCTSNDYVHRLLSLFA